MIPRDELAAEVCRVRDRLASLERRGEIVLGEDVRLLVSDVYAAEAYPLGLEVLDRLGPSLPPDDDDTDDPLPGGDLRIVEDFGMPKDEVELVLDDVEAYPDEQLSTIATRIGFGEQFDALVEQLD